MSRIRKSPLPEGSLLSAYVQRGAYTDCYATDLPHAVTLAQYVGAFYTTPLFKLERFILRWAVNRPSTDADAQALGAGSTERFAAWDVEQRAPDQLLLCDLYGRTRSWLRVAALAEGGTRLYFGSAVVPRKQGGGMGFVFTALLGVHHLYSRALLRAARARLARSPAS